MMTKEQMTEFLAKGTVKVTFVKLNGEEREMLATLMADVLPETKGTGRAPNPDVVTVFDIEKSEWRAFRVDSVIAFDPQ